MQCGSLIVKPFRQRPLLPALLGFLCLATAPGLLAQAPEYRPPPPPTKHTGLELRMRYLFAPDVQFRGLGNIPLSTDNVSVNNPLLGSERAVRYDDGQLQQDYISTDLVEGGSAGERVPSPNTDATSDFIYYSPEQLDPDDPSVLYFHRYAAVSAPDQSLSADADGSLGWEINYTKYLKWNRSLGIQVGFSFNGFDSRLNDEISADLFVQEFRHRMEGGADVPDLPDPTLDEEGNVQRQDPYQGPETREEVETENLLEWAANLESEELIPEGATVDTEADLRSSVYTLRAGPVYSLSPKEGFARNLALRLGAGLSALYYSGEFSTYQILQNPTGGPNPSRGLSTTSEAAWQLGGYIDASAEYQFTRRLSFFSGMQVQSGNDYEQENRESNATVDFQSQIYVHAGFGFRF
jgi:hypothetical protein